LDRDGWGRISGLRYQVLDITGEHSIAIGS
jgi:hypothetical protein